MALCPHVKHAIVAQRMSGPDFIHFDRFERLLLGNHAAQPQLAGKSGRRLEVDFAALASGGLVR